MSPFPQYTQITLDYRLVQVETRFELSSNTYSVSSYLNYITYFSRISLHGVQLIGMHPRHLQ